MEEAAPKDPNRFARTLFAPLPERYDRLAEVLSMGQNGRWRRAMVDHIVAGPTGPGAGRGLGTGRGGPATGRAGRRLGWWASTSPSTCCAGASTTWPSTASTSGSGWSTVGPSRCPSPTPPSMPSPSPTCCATSTTRRPPWPSWPGWSNPGGRWPTWSSSCPRSRFWRFWWWGYTRLLLPVGGWIGGGRAWFEVGRFLGPNISAHYRRYPVDWTVEAWRRAGFVDVAVRRMSLGGGLVMWGRRAGG